MNSLQVINSAVVCPKAFLRAPPQVRGGLRPLPPVSVAFARKDKLPSLKLGTSSLNSRRLAPPVYASLGGAMSGDGDKKSAEVILRKQLREAKDGGGGGKNPPSKRVTGGGDDYEREKKARAAMFDEAIQVTLATLGFLFLYYYIVSGEETLLLAKDFTAYKYKGKKSLRLTQALERWEEFCQNVTEIGRATGILYVPRLAFSFFRAAAEKVSAIRLTPSSAH